MFEHCLLVMIPQHMHAPLILQVGLAVPLPKSFEYLPPGDCDYRQLQPGVRVRVEFGRQIKIGVLLAMKTVADYAEDKLKPALAIIDPQPLLTKIDLELLTWVSQYYHHPLGEVLVAALPVLLRQGRPASLIGEYQFVLTTQGRATEPTTLKRAARQQKLLHDFQQQQGPLSSEALATQKTALKALMARGLVTSIEVTGEQPMLTAVRASELDANLAQHQAINHIVAQLCQFAPILLEGVTGSGKTEVYMQVMAAALQRGLQVLVLLPEISLTPQLEQRFRQRFAAAIVTYHSKLTDKQRLQAWLQFREGRASIMLGTRSAVFTPMHNPGLIILDEEHDMSFKQQEGFRFSARDVAIARAKKLNIPVVLGTATPSLESLLNANRGRYHWLHLPIRAGNAVEPTLQLLDIRNKRMQGGLSEALLAAMHKTLQQGQQVLLFLNRRGYAPVQICHSCGHVARCPGCDANLVIHVAEERLRCHHCGFEQRLPKHCPACRTGELQALGMGTERIEQILTALFPQYQVVRLDRDSTQRKGMLEDYLQQIHSGEANIILGTQMLAKGHHFPKVTLVALLDVDSGLFSIDYRSGERLAQLIVQVSGRAGRADQPGQVVLQTRHPEHPWLQLLLQGGYRAFAEQALADRQLAGLPPYGYQALLRVQAKQPQLAQTFMAAVTQCLADLGGEPVSVWGPVSAPMFKRAGQFRYQLLLQSPRRQDLQRLLADLMPALQTLQAAKTVKWSIDVDPQDLY